MFGNHNAMSDQSISIDGTQVKIVNETKFLGVIIDSKLSWKPHVRHIKTKISKSL